MKWIKALGALMLLGAIIIGTPLLLVAFVGSPIPDDLSLGMQLTDAVLIQLLSLIVWAFWLQTCWCIALEIVAAAKSHQLNRTPGAFGVQTLFARTMIGLVVAAFVSVPLLPSPVQANTAPVPTRSPSQTPEAVTPAAEATPEAGTETPAVDPAPATVEVVVERGDTLWALAQTHLGDAERWTEIAQLNDGLTMVDGSTFASASLLRPGWVLQLPSTAASHAPTTAPATAAVDYTVQAGDTLSQIAADELGDPGRYPEIFEASKHLEQPIALTDPNLIYPGQVLDIPDAPSEVQTPQPAPAPASAPDPAPAPAPELDSSSAPEPEPAPAPEVVVPDEAALEAVPEVLAAPGVMTGSQGTVPSSPAPPPPAPQTTNPTPADHGELDTVSTEADAADDSSLPGWVWPSMACGGALLAGGLLLALRQRRSTQHRSRRPGLVLAMPTAIAREAERSIATAGAEPVDLIVLVDQVLRRTAAHLRAANQQTPDIAAVEITPADIALHLRTPAEAPQPWATSEDSLLWILDRSADLDSIGPDPLDDPSPWPLLVTIGTDTDDGIWLLNLEGQAVTVTGDPQKVQDFARYVAAEIACNPWSRHTALDLLGIAGELAPINPERISCHDDYARAAAEAVATAVNTATRLDASGDRDASAARAAGTDPDTWPSRLVIVGGPADVDELDQFAGLLESQRGRTGSSLLVTAEHADQGMEVRVDAFGRLTVPAVNLRLDGVGLTPAEAGGCATLLTHGEVTVDEPAPELEGDDPWADLMTTTGALRDEHRIDRSAAAIELSESILPEPDETYWSAATTTEDDLSRLAPKVSLRTRDQVADADPGLDEDLAEWNSDTVVRPRLSLLGSVSAKTAGAPLDKRRPFYTEMFAYLATRPYGATTDEVAEAFDITPARTRTDIGRLRDWLGTDPQTGAKYLPDAREAPAAAYRGAGVYQVVDALIDLELFRRLRTRGESRGPDGVDDLVKALGLVSGQPFDKLRPTGWGWMHGGVRLDQHAICAIADVAHMVVIEMLTRGDTASARTVVSIALLAAPDEEMSRLDLAAVLEAEGHTDEAVRLVREQICNRSDDGDAPTELPARTAAVLQDHPALLRRAI
ncbi:LysM peptidoglycan-binding domain-containing protein [Aeromicrobium sp. Leaf350]|uniref:LysM peptidoglycan-binding domain-containing protein n=1 Tax=Aeromicrobium sp. Leaf350 TaxID=2876565 RepID=UPI001E5C4AF2|nr:LysM peptidoglycan-binding domain-containing protein [Aeromicrobium sp. Leaf350]